MRRLYSSHMATDRSNPDPLWCWEKIDPSRAAAAGDLAKMFKNEPVKTPGVLAEDAPAPEATLLVREAIQNSWDAALESREESSVAASDAASGGGGGVRGLPQVQVRVGACTGKSRASLGAARVGGASQRNGETGLAWPDR